jgi:cytochrome c
MRIYTIVKFFGSLLIVCSGSSQANDTEIGRDVYLSYCVACHAFACNRDGADSYAPKLSGLTGRKVGGVSDFTGYSSSLKNSEIMWNDDTLNSFFMNPSAVLPEMDDLNYHKVGKDSEVEQLVEYLKTEDESVDFLCEE